MHWETFYLVCFVAGLMLSAVTLLGGMGHFGGHAGHVGHVHVPHVHVPHGHVLRAGTAASSGAKGSGGSGAMVPWWNAFSIMVFLCWFGAAGYLLTKYGTFMAVVVLVLAILAGAAGGWLIFMFIARVLLKDEHELTAEETAIVGAVGNVSAPIRAGRTGEVLYKQLGAVVSVPARSEDGMDLARHEEVYVVRYEKGIAYVRRFDDIANGLDYTTTASS